MERPGPEVTVKSAMTLDGKIATATGESKWITGPESRAYAMRLRRDNDAILVGINTVLADNPSLTVRSDDVEASVEPRRRIILDTRAQTPTEARIVSDGLAEWTTIITGPEVSPEKARALIATGAQVWQAPLQDGHPDLDWALKQLYAIGVFKLLVEGGGQVNASFLSHCLADRIAFFYAPKILGGPDAKRAVGGAGAHDWNEISNLTAVSWQELGPDLLLTAKLAPQKQLAR